MAHLGVSTDNHWFSERWSVISPCIDYCQPQTEASLTQVDSSTNWEVRCKGSWHFCFYCYYLRSVYFYLHFSLSDFYLSILRIVDSLLTFVKTLKWNQMHLYCCYYIVYFWHIILFPAVPTFLLALPKLSYYLLFPIRTLTILLMIILNSLSVVSLWISDWILFVLFLFF